MASNPLDRLTASGLRRGPVLLGIGVTVALVAVLGFVLIVTAWSGASLSGDRSALAQVKLQPFAGKLETARAFAPNGTEIPVTVTGGRITPLKKLNPGERVTVQVVIHRPGVTSWALGATQTERLTLQAPRAHVAQPWLTVADGAQVRVSFDQPVTSVAYGAAGHLVSQPLNGDASTIALGQVAPAGSIQVAAAVRSWERLGAPVTVSWFPASPSPVMVATPVPDSKITPTTRLRLTFSQPVSQVLGGARPQLSPQIPGSWRRPDSHTLEFVPSGAGAPLGTTLTLTLPSPVATIGSSGGVVQTAGRIRWTVPPGSTTRLQQLLAQAGYLPVSWAPAGDPVATTESAEVRAAVDAPSGDFTWRFPSTPPELKALWLPGEPNAVTRGAVMMFENQHNLTADGIAGAAVDAPSGDFTWRFPSTPPELKALWLPGEPNAVTRGAVMMFENQHNLTADGIAGAAVWKALIAEAIAGKAPQPHYNYVYVHRNVPQLLTLWSDGHTVFTSPGNTGVPAAPTQLGTFPVFEHIPVGTMSGTNPDGSTYNDPGIRWISYFNGGDALHAFTRASFGTPQSLGCVELPLASAAEVWPHTPIGTLVTIEN
jgi:peptidoglycan hydrolase-like protein with peptidoglycan-binding domain